MAFAKDLVLLNEAFVLVLKGPLVANEKKINKKSKRTLVKHALIFENDIVYKSISDLFKCVVL